MNTRTLLHCSRFFYCDSSNGAATSNRNLMECLARHGFAVEALCGSVVDVGFDQDPADLLSQCYHEYEVMGSNDRLTVGPQGVFAVDPPRLRAVVNGIPVTVDRRPTHSCGEADAAEFRAFLSLAESAFERVRPDVLVTYGGDPLTLEILARARRRGVVTAFTLHNFSYPDAATFADVDAVIVPSRFSAEYHRRTLGVTVQSPLWHE